ncbi:MAG TPA: acyltransferase family protein [Kofleriaceae bacterium]|nr:acyltransferase family protein [Kofleriaceae bacterium]
MPDDSAPREARGYVPELDGLRGIAILLVMIHRMYPRPDGGTPWLVEAGWVGVDLFFVISGFLIAGILLDTRRDPDFFRNFYARRVLRIFPLFYLLVGGMLLAFPLLHHREFLRQAGSPLWYLLQLGNIPEALLGRDPPYWLAPVWSLAIEEQFYLTFPLVVRLTDPAKLGRRLVGVAVLALALRIVTTELVPDRERVQYLFTLCRLDTIAIGCLLAVLVRSPRYAAIRARITQLTLPVIGGALVVAIATQLDRTTWFGRTFGYSVVALGFAALVLLVLERRDRRATGVLRNAALRYLGKLCFGLYLLHRPADTIVTALAHRTAISDASLLWLPVKIAVAVGLATISWRLLERPFLRLKRRFTSRAHPMIRAPGAAAAAAAAVVIGCSGGTVSAPQASQLDAAVAVPVDARIAPDAAPIDAMPDGAPPPLGHALYPEGALHSPIPGDVAAGLAAIAGAGAGAEDVFAKIGDSMTVSPSFLVCVDGGACNLGPHTDLAPTVSFFAAGHAAGTSPFDRTSLAATGGWTAGDVIAGTPSPLDQELAAIAPRYAVTLLGTNDVRTARSLDAFGADLWTIVDRLRAHGTIPILSTLPAQHGDPDANAKIPLYNRAIRAIAQGRGVPLVDLHQAFEALPDEGIGADGIHPTIAPDGACVLTTADLQYGYNTRNLLTLEALDRARRARGGAALDATVTRRAGDGSHARPYLAQLPLVDLADTRAGDASFTSYAPCGLAAPGREIVYRLDLDARTTISAFVIDRDPVDVDVAILDGALAATSCVATGAQSVSATVGPGPVYVVVDSPVATAEGEFALVVQ